jgi:hypothetical protein
MGMTAAILTAVNTGLSYSSQRNAASAADTQGKFEAGILRQNADFSDQQAADAVARGQIDEGRQRLDTKQRLGASKAALAAQGVDVGYGSALDVQSSEAQLGELDALTIRNSAAREAWGYKVQGLGYRQQAKLAELGGINQGAALRSNATSTLLTGAVNTYGLYSSARQTKKDLRGSQYKAGG